MKNPCDKCYEEGIKNVSVRTLSQIAHKFYKVKIFGQELTLCPYHFDKLLEEYPILKIKKIENGRIVFENDKVIDW